MSTLVNVWLRHHFSFIIASSNTRFYYAASLFVFASLSWAFDMPSCPLITCLSAWTTAYLGSIQEEKHAQKYFSPFPIIFLFSLVFLFLVRKGVGNILAWCDRHRSSSWLINNVWTDIKTNKHYLFIFQFFALTKIVYFSNDDDDDKDDNDIAARHFGRAAGAYIRKWWKHTNKKVQDSMIRISLVSPHLFYSCQGLFSLLKMMTKYISFLFLFVLIQVCTCLPPQAFICMHVFGDKQSRRKGRQKIVFPVDRKFLLIKHAFYLFLFVLSSVQHVGFLLHAHFLDVRFHFTHSPEGRGFFWCFWQSVHKFPCVVACISEGRWWSIIINVRQLFWWS